MNVLDTALTPPALHTHELALDDAKADRNGAGPLPVALQAVAATAQSTHKLTSEEACAALVSDFGLAIRQLRERQGLSQEKLSELSELNRSYVGEVERGRAIASIVTAHKLAHALNVDLATLLRQGERLERLRLAQHLRLASIAC